MKNLKQANRRVLATDEWLRVDGCDKVYALGDCATINQRKVVVTDLLLNLYFYIKVAANCIVQ